MILFHFHDSGRYSSNWLVGSLKLLGRMFPCQWENYDGWLPLSRCLLHRHCLDRKKKVLKKWQRFVALKDFCSICKVTSQLAVQNTGITMVSFGGMSFRPPKNEGIQYMGIQMLDSTRTCQGMAQVTNVGFKITRSTCHAEVRVASSFFHQMLAKMLLGIWNKCY